jgi:UDP:flavonoid glycosyltransferase YjiC (YdhE family)
MVVHPMFADQFVNAELMASSGAGIVTKSGEVISLRKAVDYVLLVDSFSTRSKDSGN